MSEKQFIVETVEITDCNTDVSRIAKVITDTKETYSYEDLYEVAELLNEQQATINELQDTVYDELDKALKVLEEIYEDYPKNNVHRLYNALKGLKEMIK